MKRWLTHALLFISLCFAFSTSAMADDAVSPKQEELPPGLNSALHFA